VFREPFLHNTPVEDSIDFSKRKKKNRVPRVPEPSEIYSYKKMNASVLLFFCKILCFERCFASAGTNSSKHFGLTQVDRAGYEGVSAARSTKRRSVHSRRRP
jgi:hypothetical protein